MAVDGYTGVGAYIKFGSTVLSTGYRTFSPSEEAALVDKSSGGDTEKSYLARLNDGSAETSFVVPSGTAGTALWGAVVKGASGTLEWGEEGTASGKPKHTVLAIVKSRRKQVPYQDLVIATVAFQFSGAVSDSAY